MQETHVGNKLRELRKARGLSQEEVARGVGTTRQTITSIEVGKYTASLPLALRLARYFGVTVEALFWLVEDLLIKVK